MDCVALKYITLISSSLKKFRKKDAALWNFRCPYCGDSKRNPNKARGYIFQNNGEPFFKCHKCGTSKHFDEFLKDQDEALFKQYAREKYFKPKESAPVLEPTTTIPVFKFNPLRELRSVAKLEEENLFRQYVISRKIPEDKWNILFECPAFKTFTEKLVPGKFSEASLKHEEGRLLIPYFTSDGTMFGYSGRSLAADAYLRYINITLDDSVPKLYGLERWNNQEKTYVVEGPIDSLFLTNSLASMGNSMVSALRDFPKEQFVCVYDNEPRSPTTKSKISQAIDAGYKVCLWPNSWHNLKDINKMILSGLTSEDILLVINNCTFHGLEAKLRLSRL